MIDAQLQFSENQAITETASSENIIDLGKREIAFGTPVPLLIRIVEDFNTLTSLTIAVETADNEQFSSAVELASSNVLLADLKAGKIVPLCFMPAGNKGFVRLKYTVVGSNPTTGKISAYITDALPQSFHNC